MTYPRDFISPSNFDLALTRLLRGQNSDYKRHFRPLLQPHELARRHNLKDLRAHLNTRVYQPASPTYIHVPKPNGILRPIALLSIDDLVVYQAIGNLVGAKFATIQKPFAYHRTFASIYTNKKSPFLFHSWKVGQKRRNAAVREARKSGKKYLATFDLVAFYQLIDHEVLRQVLEARVRSQEILDLLFLCLAKWNPQVGTTSVKHGIPQGPETSSFLAEILLLNFDSTHFGEVEYVRYVDDIFLLANSQAKVRRALLQLDLLSKDYGLVPQAEKIEVAKVKNIDGYLKQVPSPLAAQHPQALQTQTSQKELAALFRSSARKIGNTTEIRDETQFKFTLSRLRPRRSVLRIVAPLLTARPDLSSSLASYIASFGSDREAANVLNRALKDDPSFDSAAADYISALDVCEPKRHNGSYSRTVRATPDRSVEHSILLATAVTTLLARRAPLSDGSTLIGNQSHSLTRVNCLHRLTSGPSPNLRPISDFAPLLEREVRGVDHDAARYCALALLVDSLAFGIPPAACINSDNRAVQLLLQWFGYRRRTPRRKTILDEFFQSQFGINTKMPWKTLLGADFANAATRCVELPKGDPSTRVNLLDTFNDLLIHHFSLQHSQLVTAYNAVAGHRGKPDYGAWLYDQRFTATLPRGRRWFIDVHDLRQESYLSHPSRRRRGRPSTPIRPIDWPEINGLMLRAATAYGELLTACKALI